MSESKRSFHLKIIHSFFFRTPILISKRTIMTWFTISHLIHLFWILLTPICLCCQILFYCIFATGLRLLQIFSFPLLLSFNIVVLCCMYLLIHLLKNIVNEDGNLFIKIYIKDKYNSLFLK